MEIKVTKLKEVMELVKPVVPKKPTVKSIACLCLGSGKAVATDLETMVIANLPEATEPMLLPYSAIAEMLKYVPGSEALKIELKGKMVSLTWKMAVQATRLRTSRTSLSCRLFPPELKP